MCSGNLEILTEKSLHTEFESLVLASRHVWTAHNLSRLIIDLTIADWPDLVLSRRRWWIENGGTNRRCTRLPLLLEVFHFLAL